MKYFKTNVLNDLGVNTCKVIQMSAGLEVCWEEDQRVPELLQDCPEFLDYQHSPDYLEVVQQLKQPNLQCQFAELFLLNSFKANSLQVSPFSQSIFLATFCSNCFTCLIINCFPLIVIYLQVLFILGTSHTIIIKKATTSKFPLNSVKINQKITFLYGHNLW